MTDAEKAYAEAERLIAVEREAPTGQLHLLIKKLNALTTLPPEISELKWLTALSIDNTQVTDITPLKALTALAVLYLENTQVSDLRLCRDLPSLDSGHSRDSLYFRNTLATRLDPKLEALSQIKDGEGRTRKTLDYLNSLDDAEYDTFLARRKRELGIVEGQAVATPPKPSANAKARAAYLAPRIAAHREVILPLADQIQTALSTWQNETGTNQLPEELQLIEHLANGFALAVQQSDIQDLEVRLAYLESEGQKLATLLKQEQAKTAALSHELSEAKTAKFAPAFREEMGKRSAQMVTGGVYAFTGLGVTYLLGEAHPITKALISFISPK